jgi:hypothetical protein
VKLLRVLHRGHLFRLEVRGRSAAGVYRIPFRRKRTSSTDRSTLLIHLTPFAWTSPQSSMHVYFVPIVYSSLSIVIPSVASTHSLIHYCHARFGSVFFGVSVTCLIYGELRGDLYLFLFFFFLFSAGPSSVDQRGSVTHICHFVTNIKISFTHPFTTPRSLRMNSSEVP